MGKIDLFKKYSYSIEILNAYNRKLFVLKIIIGSYNCLVTIIISHLKPYYRKPNMTIIKKK